MAESDRRKYLRGALSIVGLIFFCCWPLAILWPPWSATPSQKGFLAIWFGSQATLGVFLIIASKLPGHGKAVLTFEELLVRGAHVLYLRSFREDDSAVKATFIGVNREGYLANVLREVGPVVAVGRPGEVLLPVYRAQRIYFRGEEWHEKVLELIKSARLIVLAADITDGLLWEIAQVVTHGQAEKVIVAPPYGRAWFGPIEGYNYRNARAKVYERFRTITEGIFPAPLPQSIPHLSYLAFELDWRPKVLLAPAAWKTFVFGQTPFSRVGIAETLRPHLARQNIRLTRWRTFMRGALFFPFMGLLQGWLLIIAFIACFIALSALFGGLGHN